MSTMLELPDDVMREVESQAARAGREPRDFVVSFLRQAFRPTESKSVPPQAGASLDTDPRTGLPVFRCDPDAPARSMTVEQLLALEQNALLNEDLSRAGLPH